MDYSVVVPVYNEEESLIPLHEEISNILFPVGSFEIIFIDDCSSDQSPKILGELSGRFPDKIRVLTLPKRCGQTYALKRGLDESSGQFVITMDADLQNDPADILLMIKEMEKGDFDCVCGWRKARQDSWLKARMSKFANFVQRSLTGLSVHDVSCTLRVYKRACVNKIPLEWEGQHRFIPLSLSLQGFKVGEIISNHRLRKFGQSKYSHKRVFRVIFDFFRILLARGK